MSAECYAVTLSYTDRPGIVAAVSRALFEDRANILEAHQFYDQEGGIFLRRIAFDIVADNRPDALRASFNSLAHNS
jgi:formyltetrahydrofolate deformylase